MTQRTRRAKQWHVANTSDEEAVLKNLLRRDWLRRRARSRELEKLDSVAYEDCRGREGLTFDVCFENDLDINPGTLCLTDKSDQLGPLLRRELNFDFLSF